MTIVDGRIVYRRDRGATSDLRAHRTV
jgi:hypothetical protein